MFLITCQQLQQVLLYYQLFLAVKAKGRKFVYKAQTLNLVVYGPNLIGYRFSNE